MIGGSLQNFIEKYTFAHIQIVLRTMSTAVKYFVMKNEPSEFSIDHLQDLKVGKWDGIRNYQARNLMKSMKVGDKAFFYHSSCPRPGIYGSMTIHREYFPDSGALDKKNPYYDPKATEEKNPWVCVDVAFVEKFQFPLYLEDIRKIDLGPCPMTAKGNRLSIIPVSQEQYTLLENAIGKLNSAKRQFSNELDEGPLGNGLEVDTSRHELETEARTKRRKR